MPSATVSRAARIRILAPRPARDVDNLTHTLLAAALARTRLQRLSGLAAPALVVGANLPDLDAVVRLWAGREGYLVHHRGVSHSLLGVALQAGLVACGLRWLDRLRERRTGRPAASWAGALTLSAIAAFSHPLLDWLNTYGWRPWLPFDGRWIYGDTLFIVDPWLWLLLGAPAALAGPRTAAGHWTWGVLAGLAAATIVLAAQGGIVPAVAALAWFAGLVLIACARWRGFGRRSPAGLLRAAAAGTAAYLLAMGALSEQAMVEGLQLVERQRASEDPVLAATHAPGPGDPLHWQILVETERAVYVQELHLVQGPGSLLRLEKHGQDPAVLAAIASDCARAWRSFVRYPHAALRRDPNGAWVELMDARYQTESRLDAGPAPPRGSWCSSVVRVEGLGTRCEGQR